MLSGSMMKALDATSAGAALRAYERDVAGIPVKAGGMFVVDTVTVRVVDRLLAGVGE